MKAVHYIVALKFSSHDTRYFAGFEANGGEDWTIYPVCAQWFETVEDATSEALMFEDAIVLTTRG